MEQHALLRAPLDHVVLYCAVSAKLEEHSPPASTRGTQEIRYKTNTRKPSLELSIEELEVMLPLASDQLFRNEFIDIRIPGYEQNREKVQAAKAVINRIKERLREVQQQQSPGAMRLSIRYP